MVRESKNKWERRCPLTPKEVRKLVSEDGIRVIVQSSSNRCYSDMEFKNAGAIISEDLQSAKVILGVKEISIEDL
jgi:alpha-aminoadipic semialdehyde synthase